MVKFRSEEERVAIMDTWLIPLGVRMPPVPKARRQMYAKLMRLQRRWSEISCAISRELEREGIGAGLPWHEQWRVIEKVREQRIEAWEEAWLGSNPPVPQTWLEELLDEHHRTRWAEWDLCDDIEKKWGAVSPLYDSRPGAIARPCPHRRP
jgi:hypothetical protein